MPAGAGGRGGRLGEQGLQRGDLFVYGVEDRGDLVADVAELDGEAVAQGAPGLAVRAGERGEGLDGAQRVRVLLVRLVQQAVALGRVVRHPGERAADLAELLVVEVSAAVPLDQPACLAQAVGRLVEVGHTALVVAVGQVVELEVLDAALQAVERVAGQGARARSGHSAEGTRGHPDAQSAGREALGEPGARSQLAQTGGPVRTPGPGGTLLRYRRSGCLAPLEHGLEGGDQLGPLDDLDLGVQHGFGQLAQTGGEGQHAALLGLFRSSRGGRSRSFGLLGRRTPVGLLLIQGLGEGVRPPVRRYVRDHWRHLLSS